MPRHLIRALALTLFSISATVPAFAELPAYKVTAEFPGKAFRKINAHGQLASGGTVNYRGFRLYLPLPAYNLPAGLHDIPALETQTSVQLADVEVFTDSGIVVGKAYFNGDSQKKIFTWNNGVTTIETTSALNIIDVNERGDMAGTRNFAPFFKLAGGTEQPITTTPFGNIGGTGNLIISATVHAINDAGDVLCGARRETSQPGGGFTSEFAAFVVRTATLSQFVIPGATAEYTLPEDINNNGQIVGTDANGIWIYFPQASGGVPAGFRRASVDWELFPVINDQGIALFGFNKLWHGGTLINANSLLPAGSAWQVTRLIDINKSGQILAIGQNSTASLSGAIILTPDVPVTAAIDVSIRTVPGGNNIEVTWPIAGTASFQLQSNDDLSGTWNNVTVAPVASGGMNRLTVPRSGPQMFFRLKRTP
jgi:hypothetical protein